MKKISAVPLLCCVGLSMPSVTWAVNFPSAGVDDNVSSLGKFGIRLTQAKGVEWLGVSFCPGDNDNPAHDVCLIESPVLLDSATKIGRSDPHTDGDATDTTNGADVCVTTPTCTYDNVKDGDFTVVPNTGVFTEGVAGTREVHTKMVSLNMTDPAALCGQAATANAVRAGSAASAQPRSIGEVEDVDQAADDFPAESFFNMFVEIDFDGNGDGDLLDNGSFPNLDMTLYNKNDDPLVIQATGLDNFPPSAIVYEHNGTEFAPAVYNKADDEKIGWITIAAHGVNYDCGNLAGFIAIYDVITPLTLVTLIDNSFTATASNGAITIAWETASEIDNAGFFIWRGQLKADKTECSKDGEDYTEVKRISPFILAQGSGAYYSYSDSQVASGNTYCYALEDVDLMDKHTFHSDDIPVATVP